MQTLSKKVSSLIILVSALFGFAGIGCKSGPSTLSVSGDLAKKASRDDYPFVVRLELGHKKCTGFAVSPDIIWTAAHCLEGIYSALDIRINSKYVACGFYIEPTYRKMRKEGSKTSSGWDLAAIYLPDLIKIPTAVIADKIDAARSQEIVFVGFQDNKVGETELTVAEIKKDDAVFYQPEDTNKPIGVFAKNQAHLDLGDSGGPLLNDRKQVLGVNSSTKFGLIEAFAPLPAPHSADFKMQSSQKHVSNKSSSDPNDFSQIKNSKAIISLIDSCRYREAIVSLKAEASRSKQNLSAHYVLAHLHYRLNEMDNYKAELLLAWEAEPSSLRVNSMLGRLYLVERNFAKAREYVEKALAIDGKDPKSLMTNGLIFFLESKNYAEADRYSEEAFTLFKDAEDKLNILELRVLIAALKGDKKKKEMMQTSYDQLFEKTYKVWSPPKDSSDKPRSRSGQRSLSEIVKMF